MHRVVLDAFHIDISTVTNAQFACFVDDTGYESEAEIAGRSAVFKDHFVGNADEVVGAAATPWWLAVSGANWRQPQGSRSTISDLADHPVVHVSHNDALAYCNWAGRALPTEAQWECAARGGKVGRRYPWGDTLLQDNTHRANLWQGTFPVQNDADDGWHATAPVQSYLPNDYGLWQMTGNVWEWCADWFSPNTYANSETTNPSGPATGRTRVIRGGSFLCHHSYCNRYRLAARSSNTPESTASNIGFRTVAL